VPSARASSRDDLNDGPKRATETARPQARPEGSREEGNPGEVEARPEATSSTNSTSSVRSGDQHPVARQVPREVRGTRNPDRGNARDRRSPGTAAPASQEVPRVRRSGEGTLRGRTRHRRGRVSQARPGRVRRAGHLQGATLDDRDRSRRGSPADGQEVLGQPVALAAAGRSTDALPHKPQGPGR